MSRWTTRDGLRLRGVHPDLEVYVGRILEAMEMLGWAMMVVEGVRTTQRQQDLYAQGRTKPGPVVTRVDGVKTLGAHQLQADGFGHAVDMAFIDDPGTKEDETYDPSMPWDLYGLMAQKCGLVWGGAWLTMRGDLGHVELATRRPAIA